MSFRVDIYGRSDRGVNLCSRASLHTRQNMAVEIKHYPNARMPEALLCDFRMHAVRESVSRMSEAEVMKPDPRQPLGPGEDPDKLMSEAVCLDWVTTRPGKHMGVVCHPSAQLGQFHHLVGPVPP